MTSPQPSSNFMDKETFLALAIIFVSWIMGEAYSGQI